MTHGSAPLDRINLDAEGIAYVNATLEHGLMLSQLVRQVDLSAGSAYTLVPSGTPPSRLRRWSEGGLMPSNQGLEALVAELWPLLQMPSTVLIAENAMARPQDELIQSRSTGYFTHRREVYEYRVAPSDFDDIRRCMRAADAGYSLNAVVAEAVAPPPDRVGEGYLERVVDGLRMIVTRAYDGEGFVLWRSYEVECQGVPDGESGASPSGTSPCC